MKNAVAGVGLAPDAAMVTFPVNMFLPGADIDPLKERRREVYDGLLHWKSGFAQAAGRSKMLEADFPGVEVLPIDAYPQGNALIGEEETARLVKKSGVDAVIVGNAA